MKTRLVAGQNNGGDLERKTEAEKSRNGQSDGQMARTKNESCADLDSSLADE